MAGGAYATLNAFLTEPLALTVAGALAAVLLVLLIFALRRSAGRAMTSLVWLGFALLATGALIGQMTLTQQLAERRALAERAAALDRTAFAPGSALGCLDAGAGDTVENACEKVLFASPQSVAAAVAYMSARLRLLADAAALAEGGGAELAPSLARTRRAIELDRFGIAAQALAARDDCTAEQCPVFALLGDTNTIKANMKARVFEQYVSRYVEAWNAPAPKSPLLSSLPAPPAAVAPDPAKDLSKEPTKPVSGKYDFPSSASIPPVSIMNAEPPLPPPAAEAAAPPGAPGSPPPMPPKRPVEAPPAAAR